MKNVGDALSQTRHFSLFDLNDEIDHSGTGILPLEDFTLQAAKNIGKNNIITVINTVLFQWGSTICKQ